MALLNWIFPIPSGFPIASQSCTPVVYVTINLVAVKDQIFIFFLLGENCLEWGRDHPYYYVGKEGYGRYLIWATLSTGACVATESPQYKCLITASTFAYLQCCINVLIRLHFITSSNLNKFELAYDA